MDSLRSTGQVADLLGTIEPRLNDLIRRRKIAPPPEVVCGRRLWRPEHVAQAAQSLGLPTDEIERLLAGVQRDVTEGAAPAVSTAEDPVVCEEASP